MNAPVDVLAVMAAAIETVAGFDDADHADDGDTPIIAPQLANMREARAAVAELVEAAKAVAEVLSGPRDRLGRLQTDMQNPLLPLRVKYDCGPARDYVDGSAQVLNAALARCGGAK